MKVLLLIPALLVLAACASPDNAAPRADGKPSTTTPRVGGDRDAHGCIGSAGYSWCETTQRCERPWELAKQKGFANSAQAYDQFCRNGAAK